MEITTENAHLQGESISKKEQELITQLVNIRKEQNQDLPFENLDGYEMLLMLGKKRGFVVSGGEIDTLRSANILLDEFRGSKLGEIALETPDEMDVKE